MKKVIIIACALLLCSQVDAQVINRDRIIQPQEQPVYNPYQLPNYYQNNSSFTNNSMQTNRPANPYAGPYTGNADYVNPTRYENMGAPFNTNATTPIQTAPVNINNSTYAPGVNSIIAPASPTNRR